VAAVLAALTLTTNRPPRIRHLRRPTYTPAVTERVALTFDAEHPSRRHGQSEAPSRILDLLKERSVRATFFVQGKWAESYPELTARIAREGHLVGNHSYYHAYMHHLTGAGMRADILRAQEVIGRVAGADPRPWFRCPYGAADVRVDAQLRSLGYRKVGWNVVADDWEPERTAKQVEEAVVEGATRHPRGAVVLLHTWPASVPAALPGILDRLAERNAVLVTVEELMDSANLLQ
jgi:peptidoglycan-N-acetylglucosamine deacetylase